MEPNKTRSFGATSNGAGNTTQGGAKPDVVHDVQGLASKVVDQAKGLVSDQVTGQKERSAGDLGKIANAIRQSRDSLSDTPAGPYVEKAAEMLDRVSASVRNANLRDTVRSAEKFARRDPLLFIGGAFVVGLLAGRFLKSSAQHSDQGDDESAGQRMLPEGSAEGFDGGH